MVVFMLGSIRFPWDFDFFSEVEFYCKKPVAAHPSQIVGKGRPVQNNPQVDTKDLTLYIANH